MRFENLSGDPSLEWVGRAASESLAVSLSGAMDGPVLRPSALGRLAPVLGVRQANAPGISVETQRALLASASRLISGYVERSGGQIRIVGSEEDLSSGKTLRILTATDASATSAINRLAQQFSAKAGPGPTANPVAMRLYAVSLESPITAGIDDLEHATQMDPAFGEAWVALASLEVARGDRAAAAQTIDQGERQKLDSFSKARLALESANLQPDQTARVTALRNLVAVSRGDIVLLRNLAETETAAGQFEMAAADWRKLSVLLPADPATWNSLGYSLSFAGDYKNARAALEQYAQLRPKDANAQDSLGDLDYSFRKFSEASASYLKAHDLQPDFERYGDLYKAAWAKFHAGDKPGADKLFNQFRDQREKIGDSLAPLMAADWLYRTGHKPEAFASLRKSIAGTQSQGLRSNAYAQLTIWELLDHNRAQAAQDSLAIGPKLSDAPMFIARFAAFPSASAAEWQARAEQLIPPAMAGLRPLALGYALLLDGKRDAALPIWAQIAKGAAGTDFFARAVYTRLQNKTIERPLLPDPTNFNEFAAVVDAL